MLQRMGKKVQSVVLGVIVFMLCAVFILEFGGPQSEGCASGLSARGYAAKIYGTTISDSEFRSVYKLWGFEGVPVQTAKLSKMRELALNALIERELLAREARRLGLNFSEEDIMLMIAKDGTIYRGASVDAPPQYSGAGPVPVGIFKNKEGAFDKEGARQFIQNYLRRSVGEFAQSQAQEALAHHMRGLIASGVTVSEQELWQNYELTNDRVSLDYVRVAPAYFKARIQPTDAELETWSKAHKKELDKEYEAQKFRFTNLEPQVKTRRLLIKVEKDADEKTKAAARLKAEGLLARAKAGQDFAALARQFTEDKATAAQGGDLGYNPRGRLEKALDTAAFALKQGDISDVLETDSGFEILKVEGVRKGDVPLAEAKKELAKDLYITEKASAEAKTKANQLLSAWKAKNALQKAIEDVFGTKAAEAKPTDASEEPASLAQDDSPLAPVAKETELFNRQGTPIPGPFDNGVLLKQAFSLNEKQPFTGAPLQMGEEWVVIKLKERKAVRAEDFTESEKSSLRERLTQEKAKDSIRQMVHALRKQAEDDDAIRVGMDLNKYENTQDS